MKKGAALKSLCEKSCEIKGGDQQMAAMILNFISINIIAAICWPPPLISQLFSHRFFKAAPFFTAWLFFLCRYQFTISLLATATLGECDVCMRACVFVCWIALNPMQYGMGKKRWNISQMFFFKLSKPQGKSSTKEQKIAV